MKSREGNKICGKNEKSLGKSRNSTEEGTRRDEVTSRQRDKESLRIEKR